MKVNDVRALIHKGFMDGDFNRADVKAIVDDLQEELHWIDVGFGHKAAIIDFLAQHIDSMAMRITVDELITGVCEMSDADRDFGIVILRAALRRKPIL